MNYSGVKWTDTANGVGIRISLFVSGCPHGCPGCFNQDTWDYTAGKPFQQEIQEEILQNLGRSYIRGLSLLGGEPLAPANQEAVLGFLRKVKAQYPSQDIWCYTGYRWEPLQQGQVGDYAQEILSLVDVLVDGLFIQAEKNLSLRFRGSGNQRIIQVPDSLAGGEVLLWEG